VDAYLALVSKRDTRRYTEWAIPEDLVRRLLEAGRVAGSSRNRQPWRFVIVADPALRERVAGPGRGTCAARRSWSPLS
jgi:nitroreductase